MVGSPQSRCIVCGAPVGERKGKRTCSGKCRAALSRQRREEAGAERDRLVRALLEQALRLLEGEVRARRLP